MTKPAKVRRGTHQITAKEKEAFLRLLGETANVTHCCETVGLSRQGVYELREKDPEFAAAWARALDLGVSALEDEMMRRGKEGVEKPILYQGKVVAHVREYSNDLAMFLAKAHRPEKYRERMQTELTGAVTVTKIERVIVDPAD